MNRDEKISILEKHFEGISSLDSSDIESLLAATHELEYKQGSLIWEKSASSFSGIIVLLEGHIKVYMKIPERGTLFLYRINPDSVCVLSAPGLIGNMNKNGILYASENVRFLEIDEKVYSELERKYPQLLNHTDYYLAKILERIMELLSFHITSSIQKRTAKYLLELADDYKSDEIEVNQEDIAVDIGTKRETISRALKKLKAEKAISTSRGKIKIIDRAYLEHIESQ